MYSIRLQVRPYLAEYCSRKYSWPVSSACKVPPSSELYFLFLDLLSVRPPGAPIDRGNLEFILPNRSFGKRPDRFNYLSGRSQERQEQYLYVMWYKINYEGITGYVYGKFAKKSIMIDP